MIWFQKLNKNFNNNQGEILFLVLKYTTDRQNNFQYKLHIMKVLIDDEAFIIQKFGGVSRIFSEILKRLIKCDNQLIFYNFYSENEYLNALKLNGIKPFLKNFQFPLKGKLIRSINRFFSKPFNIKNIRYGNVNVFHSSFYSDYYLKELERNKNVKFVFTVHDLIHELMPEVEGNSNLANIKKKNLKRADHIIVVSESTKSDLLKVYPFVEKNKISVIHLANSLPIEKEKVSGLPDKYVLYVGERRGYKNFIFFINAFVPFSLVYPDYKIVCTGSMNFSNSEIKLFENLNLLSKIFHFRCNDKQLRYVYENSTMFVFPSLYEGFGLPILEAFDCKTPVLLSNTSSLPEVGKDAALYFNPQIESELTNNMLLIANNQNLRNELIENGKKRLKDFSWDLHFKNTYSIYNSLHFENSSPQ